MADHHLQSFVDSSVEMEDLPPLSPNLHHEDSTSPLITSHDLPPEDVALPPSPDGQAGGPATSDPTPVSHSPSASQQREEEVRAPGTPPDKPAPLPSAGQAGGSATGDNTPGTLSLPLAHAPHPSLPAGRAGGSATSDPASGNHSPSLSQSREEVRAPGTPPDEPATPPSAGQAGGSATSDPAPGNHSRPNGTPPSPPPPPSPAGAGAEAGGGGQGGQGGQGGGGGGGLEGYDSFYGPTHRSRRIEFWVILVGTLFTMAGTIVSLTLAGLSYKYTKLGYEHPPPPPPQQ